MLLRTCSFISYMMVLAVDAQIELFSIAPYRPFKRANDLPLEACNRCPKKDFYVWLLPKTLKVWAFDKEWNQVLASSTFAANFSTALDTCCKAGMNLLSVSQATQNDLIQWTIDRKDLKFSETVGSTVFTSAVQLTSGAWTFCGHDDAVSGSVWTKNAPANKSSQACALVNWDARSFKMTDVACSSKSHFICEARMEFNSNLCLYPLCPYCLSANRGKVVEAPPNDWSVLGEMCGNKYYLSKSKMTYIEAFQACCDLNMELLSVESQQEIDCLKKMNDLTNIVWTSATNLGCTATWQWCSSLALVSDKMPVKLRPPITVSIKNCASYNKEGGSLNHVECSQELQAVCERESPKVAAVCPNVGCSNEPPFYTNTALKITNNLQRIGIYYGKIYFYSKIQKSFENAMKECCSQGYQLASFPVTDVKDKFARMFQKTFTKSETLKSIWSSAIESTDKGSWTWCLINQKVQRLALPTAFNLANDKPACGLVQVYNISQIMDPLKPKRIAEIIPADCSQNNQFVCQAFVKRNFECTSPNCLTCQIVLNMTASEIAAMKPNDDVKKNEFVLLGVSVGRKYLQSTSQASYYDAFKSCCEMNMDLLTFTTLREWKSFVYDPFKDLLQKSIWTSGCNAGCANYWRWCTSNSKELNPKEFTGLWQPGEPNNKDSMENCISLIDHKMADSVCETPMHFICQGADDKIKVAAPKAKELTKSKPKTPSLPSCPSDVPCPSNPVFNIVNNSIPTSFIRLGIMCNRIYFYSEVKMDWKSALESCCRLNMVLLSIEEEGETSCLSRLSRTYPYMEEHKMRVWSSASSVDSADKTWMWCAVKSVVADNVNWLEGTPDIKGEKYCAVADLKNNGTLRDVMCDREFYFVCEAQVEPTESPTCVTPRCPKCDIKAEVKNEETYKTPKGFTRWGDACGSVYYQSETQENFYEAYKKCCSLNMRLLSLDQASELQCVAYLQTILPGNDTWTSASSFQCRAQWRWCSSDTALMKDGLWSEMKEDTDNMNNIEDCAWLDPRTTKLKDGICEEAMSFTCEATTVAPKCGSAKCSNVTCPQVQMNNILGIGGEQNFSLLGEACGNLYYVSNLKVNFEDAFKKCCELGGRLLSIEDNKKRECLLGLKKDREVGLLWTSAISDRGCPASWVWCGLKAKPLGKDAVWQTGQPADPLRIAYCAATQWSQQLKLETAMCSAQLKYICESPAVKEVATCGAPLCPSLNHSAVLELDKRKELDASPSFEYIGGNDTILFYISKTQVDQLTAMTACFNNGLRLLSVENMNLLLALINKTRVNSLTTWSSGSNRQCSKKWAWCSSNDKTTWPANDVIYSSKPFQCACVTWSDKLKISSESCSDFKYYICQGKIQDVPKQQLKVSLNVTKSLNSTEVLKNASSILNSTTTNRNTTTTTTTTGKPSSRPATAMLPTTTKSAVTTKPATTTSKPGPNKVVLPVTTKPAQVTTKKAVTVPLKFG